mgnify:CR=1 FL=1|jgi:hypothetical protein
MILLNEVKRKSFKNSDSENYSQTLEVKIDDALRYDSGKNAVKYFINGYFILLCVISPKKFLRSV